MSSPSLNNHGYGVLPVVNDNPNAALNRRGTIAIIVVSVIVFGVLMGIREWFEPPWLRVAIAGCAGAFFGVALMQSMKFRPRKK